MGRIDIVLSVLALALVALVAANKDPFIPQQVIWNCVSINGCWNYTKGWSFVDPCYCDPTRGNIDCDLGTKLCSLTLGDPTYHCSTLPTKCLDQLAECAEYKEMVLRERTRYDVSECNNYIISSKALIARGNGLCKDRNTRCRFWAWSGECKRNPSYMLPNCVKACEQC